MAVSLSHGMLLARIYLQAVATKVYTKHQGCASYIGGRWKGSTFSVLKCPFKARTSGLHPFHTACSVASAIPLKGKKSADPAIQAALSDHTVIAPESNEACGTSRGSQQQKQRRQWKPALKRQFFSHRKCTAGETEKGWPLKGAQEQTLAWLGSSP